MVPYVHIPVVKVGPLPLQPFGFLVALGVVIGYSLANRRAHRLGLDVPQFQSFIGWILISGFICAHVLDAIFYHWNEVLQRPWIVFELWSGLSSFGGFAGAIFGAFYWKYYEWGSPPGSRKHFNIMRPVRREKPFSILPYVDVILAVFPVAWSFGRAGCAIVHDHPGVRASVGSWLAVAYGPGPIDHFGIIEIRYGIEPRYDLGFLEMLFAIILAAGYAFTWKRGRAFGWYVVATCLIYAPVRFALDFLRVEAAFGGDQRYIGLTPAQWGCGPLFLFGLVLAVWLHMRSTRIGD